MTTLYATLKVSQLHSIQSYTGAIMADVDNPVLDCADAGFDDDIIGSDAT